MRSPDDDRVRGVRLILAHERGEDLVTFLRDELRAVPLPELPADATADQRALSAAVALCCGLVSAGAQMAEALSDATGADTATVLVALHETLAQAGVLLELEAHLDHAARTA